MDSELVSFRIDATLRREAAQVCVSLGLELNDYLRACVTHLVRDKRAAFEISGPAVPSAASASPPNPRVWAELEATTTLEAALIRLRTDISAKSAALAAARAQEHPDPHLIKRLTREHADAIAKARTLGLNDAEQAAQILKSFGDPV